MGGIWAERLRRLPSERSPTSHCSSLYEETLNDGKRRRRVLRLRRSTPLAWRCLVARPHAGQARKAGQRCWPEASVDSPATVGRTLQRAASQSSHPSLLFAKFLLRHRAPVRPCGRRRTHRESRLSRFLRPQCLQNSGHTQPGGTGAEVDLQDGQADGSDRTQTDSTSPSGSHAGYEGQRGIII